MSTRAALVVVMLLATSAGFAASRNLDAERIATTLAQLESDPVRAQLAVAEIARAREALRALEQSGRRAAKRAHFAYLAERRVDIAFATAQAVLDERLVAEQQREHDRILIEASRREAELSRLEAEKLRVQSLAREEEAERLREEAAANAADAEAALATAAQARRVADAQAQEAALARREAELANSTAQSLRLQMQRLAPTRDARGQVLTLGEGVFRPGGAALEPEAVANFDRVIEFVNRSPAFPVLIEGHTDDRGGPEVNQRISQRRADAVRAALVAKGVDGGRITAVGRGEEAPIASNESSDGRARNRRVEIVLQGG